MKILKLQRKSEYEEKCCEENQALGYAYNGKGRLKGIICIYGGKGSVTPYRKQNYREWSPERGLYEEMKGNIQTKMRRNFKNHFEFEGKYKEINDLNEGQNEKGRFFP